MDCPEASGHPIRAHDDVQIQESTDGTLVVRSPYGIWPAVRGSMVGPDETLTASLPVRESVIPVEREYKYVATRDVIDTLARPEKEIKDRYARLIAQVAIRTIHQILASVPSEVATVVTFYGHLSTTDMTTGQPIRLCLISVSAERDLFATFVLEILDPVSC